MSANAERIVAMLAEHGAKASRRGPGDGVPSHTEMLMGEAIDLIRSLSPPPADFVECSNCESIDDSAMPGCPKCTTPPAQVDTTAGDGMTIDDALKYAWAKHYAEGIVVSEAFMRQVIRTAVQAATAQDGRG